jgi:hypothetical protein
MLSPSLSFVGIVMQACFTGFPYIAFVIEFSKVVGTRARLKGRPEESIKSFALP